MLQSTSRIAGNAVSHPGGRTVQSGLIALALILAPISLVPLDASVADCGAPAHVEFEVTIEFVRVLPPGSAYEPDAIRLGALAPAVREAMKAYRQGSEGDLYKVMSKRTIHLGDPQLAPIDARHQIEFRTGGAVLECAFLSDGVATDWSSWSRTKIDDDPLLCSFHQRNQDVYVVAWVGSGAPAPNH